MTEYARHVDKSYLSPNHDVRALGTPLDLIVLHYTDMLSAEAALERLCDGMFKVSAHFLISKKGITYQLVDPEQRAWHAGAGYWQGERDINSRSIGIELDNFGHSYGPQPFPPEQVNALTDLLKYLMAVYAIPPHRIVGHSDVAPLRKQDPGELFPWEQLARKGFGMWSGNVPQNVSEFQDTKDVQQALWTIGYDCPQTGRWDENTQKVCLAFQRHFLPSELTGQFSPETGKKLRNVEYLVQALRWHNRPCLMKKNQGSPDNKA